MKRNISEFVGVTVKDNETYIVLDSKELDRLTPSKTILHRDKETTGHSHPGHEEVYLFISGNGEMLLDRERFDVGPGDYVLIKDGQYHKVFNNGLEDLVFFCVFESYDREK